MCVQMRVCVCVDVQHNFNTHISGAISTRTFQHAVSTLTFQHAVSTRKFQHTNFCKYRIFDFKTKHFKINIKKTSKKVPICRGQILPKMSLHNVITQIIEDIFQRTATKLRKRSGPKN